MTLVQLVRRPASFRKRFFYCSGCGRRTGDPSSVCYPVEVRDP